MKQNSIFKTICGLVSCILASLTMVYEAKADGNDTLGPPSIDIASGSYIMVEGTGLKGVLQPGSISIDIPADASIAQVLLYWSGRSSDSKILSDLDLIQVNGMVVTGSLIGYSLEGTKWPSHTYRADITGKDWISVGGITELTVSGLDFSHLNAGAAVVVILDDGSTTDIQILDGDDFAYEPQHTETVPITFPIEPSNDDRTGYMWLIASDINAPRPAAVDIIVDGTTNRYELNSNKGDFLDVVELEVPVPAGVSNVTAQAVSIDDGSQQPASLIWSFVSWELPDPVYEDPGCTYTQGYWKNHPDNWPTDQLSLYSGRKAMRLLRTPPKKGNAYIILAHQYIAAELNVVNGTSIPDEVLEVWGRAQELLEKYQSKGTIPKKSPNRKLAIAMAKVLDDYNNGRIGPGHCD
jgi:hypothetical protein